MTVDQVVHGKMRRLFVDAGSTTFRCLLGSKLRWCAEEIVTNNLFVSQHFRRTEADPKVILIDGLWDADTGAMVDCGNLLPRPISEVLNSAKKRRPAMALLSWHHVMLDDQSKQLCFCAKDKSEEEMKNAAMGVTESVVFVVVDSEKIGSLPADPLLISRYTSDQLIADQGRIGNGKRRVFLVTDVGKKCTKSQQTILDMIGSKTMVDNRVFLVSDYNNTSSVTINQ